MILSATRRSLMMGGGALAAGAALPGLSMAAPVRARRDGRKLGYALVGLGGFSNAILPRLAGQCENSRLAALVSGSPEKQRRIADQYGVPDSGLYNYENFDRIRDNPDVDIVYVMLPNGLHAEYTIRAARAGKHVLCEKPMANTAAEAEAMIAACRAAGRKLMIGYRCRFEPHNKEAIRIVRSGELGRLSVVTAEHGFNISPNVWRLNKALAGGGSMMDIGIYSLQAARYLTGEEPVELIATESTDRSDPRFAEVEDTINFQLRFPSGVVANCVSSYSSGHNRFRAVGAESWIDLEPATAYEGQRMRRGRAWDPNVESVTPPPGPDHFAAMLDHLSDCALSGAEPIVAGEEGLRDMRLIEAIYRSAREGRAVRV